MLNRNIYDISIQLSDNTHFNNAMAVFRYRHFLYTQNRVLCVADAHIEDSRISLLLLLLHYVFVCGILNVSTIQAFCIL